MSAFVHEVLAPVHKAGHIDKTGLAWVAQKTVNKVMERKQQQQPASKPHDLLSASRREKIKTLVQK